MKPLKIFVAVPRKSRHCVGLEGGRDSDTQRESLGGGCHPPSVLPEFSQLAGTQSAMRTKMWRKLSWLLAQKAAFSS